MIVSVNELVSIYNWIEGFLKNDLDFDLSFELIDIQAEADKKDIKTFIRKYAVLNKQKDDILEPFLDKTNTEDKIYNIPLDQKEVLSKLEELEKALSELLTKEIEVDDSFKISKDLLTEALKKLDIKLKGIEIRVLKPFIK